MSRLSPVLSTGDLPLAELHAARLDGELVRVDGCFTPVDQPDSPATRAASLALQWPERLIAEQHSAAWVWGALDSPPLRHELCASLGARARPPTARGLSVREVVIADDEYVAIGGQLVTVPSRTIVDLARFNPDVPRELLRSLARIGHVSRDECRRALDRRRNLPNKRPAWVLIQAALDP
jgi:hypothetical protein